MQYWNAHVAHLYWRIASCYFTNSYLKFTRKFFVLDHWRKSHSNLVVTFFHSRSFLHIKLIFEIFDILNKNNTGIIYLFDSRILFRFIDIPLAIWLNNLRFNTFKLISFQFCLIDLFSKMIFSVSVSHINPI